MATRSQRLPDQTTLREISQTRTIRMNDIDVSYIKLAERRRTLNHEKKLRPTSRQERLLGRLFMAVFAGSAATVVLVLLFHTNFRFILEAVLSHYWNGWYHRQS